MSHGDPAIRAALREAAVAVCERGVPGDVCDSLCRECVAIAADVIARFLHHRAGDAYLRGQAGAAELLAAEAAAVEAAAREGE